MKRALAIALSFAALTVAGTAAQSRPPFTLEILTVPTNLLPEGCAPAVPTTATPRGLVVNRPPQAGPPRVIQITIDGVVNGSGSFPTNPFIARERSDVYRIRTTVDGGVGIVRLPDAPPMTAAETAAFQMRYVQHVTDGYWASYTTPQNDSVEVHAIRFDDPSLALETRKGPMFDKSFSTRPPGTAVSERIVKGSLVVLVRGNTATRCYDAVRTYVQSLNVK